MVHSTLFCLRGQQWGVVNLREKGPGGYMPWVCGMGRGRGAWEGGCCGVIHQEHIIAHGGGAGGGSEEAIYEELHI